MEVHHHPTPKEKWHHYFLNFDEVCRLPVSCRELERTYY
jgi:hypothetical protein